MRPRDLIAFPQNKKAVIMKNRETGTVPAIVKNEDGGQVQMPTSRNCLIDAA